MEEEKRGDLSHESLPFEVPEDILQLYFSGHEKADDVGQGSEMGKQG